MNSMVLHIERINETSPYFVSPSTQGTVTFTTRYGVNYEVGFTLDYSLGIEGVYQFYISNINQVTAPRDEKVRETVIAVIEEFFRANEYAMLYVCDVSDGRQGVRNRMFHHWFEMYNHNGQYQLLSAEASFEGETYYASLLIHRQNPMFQQFAASFNLFEATLQQKLS